MATSGSIDYNLTARIVVTEALELLGIVGENETPTAGNAASCLRTLNLMLKSWQAEGIDLWRYDEMHLQADGVYNKGVYNEGIYEDGVMPIGMQSYTIVPRPLRVLSVRHQLSGGTEIPMVEISREEYFDLPVKSTTGTPTHWYYHPARDSGIIYVWPTASDTSSDIKITYQRVLEDVDSLDDNLDVTQEWLECVCCSLAVRVAPKFGISLSRDKPEILAMANDLRDKLSGWDRETAPILFQPDQRWR